MAAERYRAGAERSAALRAEGPRTHYGQEPATPATESQEGGPREEELWAKRPAAP